jgi:hypothetical protein
MVNGCCGMILLHEGIFIFTNTTTFVKILIGYMQYAANAIEMIAFC